MKKVFVDTDVILDVILSRMPFVAESAAVLSLSDSDAVEVMMSTLSLMNAHYICRKVLTNDQAVDVIFNLKDGVQVLDLTEKMLDRSGTADFKDFEDGVQHFCALHGNADCIVTRNVVDFKKSKLPVFTPKEFLVALAGTADK